MNFKTTYWLFGTLLVLLAAFGIRALIKGDKKDTSSAVFPSLIKEQITAADIDRLEIARSAANPADKQTMIFVRQGPSSWKMTAPAPTRVDGNQVEQIVQDVVGLQREKQTGPKKEPAAVGLEQPSLYVTLKKGDREWTLTVGNVTIGESAKVFVKSSDRPDEILAVKEFGLAGLFRSESVRAGGPAGSLVKTVTDFRSKGLLGDAGTAETVQKITLQGANGQPIVLVKGPDRLWRFEQPANYGEAEQQGDSSTPSFTPPGSPVPDAKPPTGVGALLRDLLGIRVAADTDFEPTDANKDLNTAYGLDANKPATFKVTLARSGGAAPETLLVGKKIDKKPPQTEDQYYVRLANEKTVAKVSAKELDPIRKLLEKPDAMRNHELLPIIETTTVDAINLQLSGQPPLEFRKTAGAWKLYDDKGAAAAVDQAALTKVLGALGQPHQVSDFPKPGQTDNQLGFDNPSLRVSLWSNAVVPPEKKPETPPAPPKPPAKPGQPAPPATPPKPAAPPAPVKPKLKKDKPDYELLFGHVEHNLVNVRRLKDGQATGDFLVPEQLLKTIKQDNTSAASLRLDFLDKSLPTFAADAVTKLEIIKTGGATLILDKTAKPGQPTTWTASRGPNTTLRTGDAAKILTVLVSLANLHPDQLVAEKADAHDLAQWKLGPARLVVTLHLKDDKDHPNGRTYRFGEDSSDKKNVYLKLDDREAVYLVPHFIFDQLSQDLIDPTIFRLEVSKVKKLKIVGKLPTVIGNPGPDGKVTVELERKGLNQWAALAGINYSVDGPKVEEFLAHLREVRAAAPVAQGSVKPEQTKFDPAMGGLEIVITQDGEKGPFTLTLGGLDATGANYYAQSNRLPGEIFLLPKAAFAPVKDKVYFGK